MAGLLVGLTGLTALGCAHANPTRAQHRREVAGAMALADATSLELQHKHSTAPYGVVDVSELPTVVDADATPASAGSKLSEHRFTPAAMITATTVGDWLDADLVQVVTEIELRNACAVELDYAFGPSDSPDEAKPASRALASHTIQTQRIPQGSWLHLWDGDRWLGAAVTTVEHGRMEVSSQCDTLEVSFELPDHGRTTFAIHWDLDADPANQAGSPTSGSPTAGPIVLDIEHRDAPEQWGTDQDDEARVALRLANLCAEPIDYGFTPQLEDVPTNASTIPGHTERGVEIPAGWWLRYQALDSDWRGGATSSLAGAVLWMAPNCVDFGVGDGAVITAPSPPGQTD
ncbi:hypothetical protein DB30_03927 [Enhygromyxa salina]|uniref:Uncharacterized protein n=2 Tax=Enhygromyxa salina TaxID=215803 RepID=A0A0C2A0M2_9BACT|nr:hypothetical protein DB30_03927 [Enhygromyxa salina]